MPIKNKIMQYKIFITFASAVLMITYQSYAQPGINSIYSAYGIGDVSVRENNGYASMGGVGVAMPSNKLLNGNNPASYSTIPYGSYVMELSFSGLSIQYKNQTQTFKANDIVVNGAAFGFNISKKIGAAVSLKRFSTVEYYTLADRYVSGTVSKLSEDITGSGGLYLGTVGVGIKATKNLSLGLTGGSIFGSITKKENIYTSSSDGFIIENNSFYNNFYAKAGLQYKFKTRNYKWVLGATLQPSIELTKLDDYKITDFSENVLLTESQKKSKFKYPLQFGTGFAISKNKSILSADYLQQNWGSTGYRGASFSTTNAQNFAVGFMHTYQMKGARNRIQDGITLMCGLQKDKSYIFINKYQVESFAATAGISFPSKNLLYNYTFGLKVGQRGKIYYPLVKENFVELNMSISLKGFLNVGGAKYF